MNLENTHNRKKNSDSVRKNLHIDMTPMVDLGFLLISFFIFTTTLTEPGVTKLYMPANHTNRPVTIPESLALTFLLYGNDSIYYYSGNFKPCEVEPTNYSSASGIGDVIRKKQMLIDELRTQYARKDLMVIIKPGKNSNYNNLVDALDEIMINDVRKYAIVDQSQEEALGCDL